MSEHAAWAVVIACIAPPPFPFTVVIAAASAFQYPRARLLGLVFAARLVRYSLLAGRRSGSDADRADLTIGAIQMVHGGICRTGRGA